MTPALCRQGAVGEVQHMLLCDALCVKSERSKAIEFSLQDCCKIELAMRAVVQRVSKARVLVEGHVAGEIGAGLVVLLGVAKGDTSEAARYLAEKTATLRIFADEAGKMNRSLVDIGGAALVISQFTLYGDARGQRRPSFVKAAPAEEANHLYEEYCGELRNLGVHVETGTFQAMMAVEMTNEGPVTILLDSDKLF
jgi:D-aminoacyl-tRNA deacylase